MNVLKLNLTILVLKYVNKIYKNLAGALTHACTFRTYLHSHTSPQKNIRPYSGPGYKAWGGDLLLKRTL